MKAILNLLQRVLDRKKQDVIKLRWEKMKMEEAVRKLSKTDKS